MTSHSPDAIIPDDIRETCVEIAKCRRYGYRNFLVKRYLATLEKTLRQQIDDCSASLPASYRRSLVDATQRHIAHVAESIDPNVFESVSVVD